MTDTVPHTMVNAVTGAHHVIQLRPKEGMTAADAQAFRAERIEEGKRIDPQTCDIIKYYVEAIDLYGIFKTSGRVSAASCSHASCPMGTGSDLATCRKKRARPFLRAWSGKREKAAT